jgi:hypothetical protein
MKISKYGIYDHYSFWHTPLWRLWWFAFFLWILGGILLIACIAAAMYWLRQRNLQRSLNPTEQALHDIANAQKQLTENAIGIHAYYQKLIAILKMYCHRELDIDLMSKTDQEISNSIQTLPFGADDKTALAAFFGAAALTKFSPETESGTDVVGDTDLIRTLINTYKRSTMSTPS